MIEAEIAVFAHVSRSLGGALEALDPDDTAARAAVARLREECTQAKEALSADTDVTIAVMLPTVQTEVRLTRGEFEALIRPTLAPSVDSLARAIASAGLEPTALKTVLLVGGSSRIPLVGQLVARLGCPVSIDAHPKHVVALGAAFMAGDAEAPERAPVVGVAADGMRTPAPAPAAAPPAPEAQVQPASAAEAAATEPPTPEPPPTVATRPGRRARAAPQSGEDGAPGTTRRRALIGAVAAVATAALIGIVVAVATLAGNSGDGADEVSSTTTTTLAGGIAADRASGRQAALRLSDLPQGWKEKPHEVTADDVEVDRSLAQCLGVDAARLAGDNPTRVYSPDLESQGGDAEVQSSVSFAPTAAEAKERLTTLERPETAACLNRSFSELIRPGMAPPQTGGEVTPRASLGQVSAQRVATLTMGDGTVAYRAVVPLDAGGQQVVVYGDLVLAVKGRAGATFAFLGLGAPFPAELAQQLVRTVVDRLPSG